VSEGHENNLASGNGEVRIHGNEEESYATAAEGEASEEILEDDYDDEIVNHDELDDYESDASLYHDTVVTQVSHEDREDAFDYEHFFLHSAMGTISQQRNRRGSFSSEDSVETARGLPTVVEKNERTALGHLRSESSDSVSTLATFATARSGIYLEESGKEINDRVVRTVLSAPTLPSATPLTAKRSTFGPPAKNSISKDQQTPSEEQTKQNSDIHNPENSNGHRPSVSSFDSLDSLSSVNSLESTGTTRSFPLVNKPKSQLSSKPTTTSEPSGSIRSESRTLNGVDSERQQTSPVHMLAKDDQLLVEKLVASLGKCVLGLQEAEPGSYDSRVWRRRLDAARRVLEGEEGAV